MVPVELAIEFARCGFMVFPLYGKRKDKPFGWAGNTPTEPENVDKVIPATDDTEVIGTWPTLVQDKYGSEVTGFGVLGSKCVVLDIDVKNGKNGLNQFVPFVTSGVVPKPTMLTRTKSGGLHVFYRRPKALIGAHVKTLASIRLGDAKLEGVDLRGNGGFVVGPNFLVDEFEPTVGVYQTKGLRRIEDLPEFPEGLLRNWVSSLVSNDLDAMRYDEPTGFQAQIRAGVVPDFIPDGARNDAFYVFINVLKSRGVSKELAKQMCLEMATRCENPDTLWDSVDLDDMLDRVFVVLPTNPFDVAADLIRRGLYQLTGWKSKPHYVILEDNPYVQSRVPHDGSSLKEILAPFSKTVTLGNGKAKKVNPMELVPSLIRDESRVDAMGFKPGAGDVFRSHDDIGAKRFINTYRPIPSDIGNRPEVWDEFRLLVSRIWGPEGSEEYQLGLDFVAWLVQRPHIKPSVAPFIMSHRRGVGKSLFFNVLVQLLGISRSGERQARLIKLDEVTGRFFDPTGCLINLIDEVQFPVHRDSRKESVAFWRHMKNLITAETVSVEIKGGSTYQVPNSAALMMAGNTGSHFPVEEFDRRLWIIDANPPPLVKGECDHLFSIVRGLDVEIDDRRIMVATLRDRLRNHGIALDLSMIRAPMTDVKRDIFLGSLTDLEEWCLTHFENSENLFARTPVITKSAFCYVAETSDAFHASRWTEDVNGFFRDMKRRGLLRPIRTKGNPNQSRNMLCPAIEKDGTAVEAERREVVYTTRDHGSFDSKDNREILAAYMENVKSITEFKTKFRERSGRRVVEALK